MEQENLIEAVVDYQDLEPTESQEGALVQMNDIMTKMFNLRQEIAALTDKKTELQSALDLEEFRLIQAMEAAGISNAGNSVCTVALKNEMYPKVEDMEAFTEWCVENSKTEMIQKRVSSAVFKEYFDNTGEFPEGISTYEKLSISMRRK